MLARLLKKWGKAGKSRASGKTPGKAAQEVVSASDWRPGDLIMGRYQVERVLAGPMGTLYEVYHSGRAVRLRVESVRPEYLSDPVTRKRLFKRAEALIRAGMHPHVTACYDLWFYQKTPFLISESVEGDNLAGWLEKGKCRDLRTALSLAVQFCHGMEFLHASAVLHLQINPATIFITGRSLLKISTSGLGSGVYLPRGSESDPILLQGAPGFAAPEQRVAGRSSDRRTDIFSFGICLWLMICGVKPFQEENFHNSPPPPLPLDSSRFVPPLLIAALRKCVAFDSRERYADFNTLRQDLLKAYQQAFKVACPYGNLSGLDLRACSLSNRAVFLADRKKAAAEENLRQALQINDALPEGIHNLIVLGLRKGDLKPEQAAKKVEAALQRLGQAPLLTILKEKLRPEPSGGGELKGLPDLQLCRPWNSLAIYRQRENFRMQERSMLDHLEKRRYTACQKLLLALWRKQAFRREKNFIKVYETLLEQGGSKQEVIGAFRLAVLPGNGKPADGLALVPSSRKVLTYSRRDREVTLWDFARREVVGTLSSPGGAVRCLAADPRGKVVALGAEDGSVTFWSTVSLRQVGSRGSHAGAVTSIGYSADGRWLASGGADGSLLISHQSSGREHRLETGGGAIRCLLVAGKGGVTITGSEDGSLHYWEPGRKEPLRTEQAHARPVTVLESSLDRLRFVTAGGDRLLRVWDARRGTCIGTIESNQEAATSVLMLADTPHLVTGGAEDLLRIWKIEKGECLVSLDSGSGGVLSLTAGPRNHVFLAGGSDGTVSLWMMIVSLDFIRR